MTSLIPEAGGARHGEYDCVSNEVAKRLLRVEVLWKLVSP